MAETIVELLTDVADAIREKKGSTEKINAQSFADEIRNLPSGGGNKWTGHADVEGLKAIGWDDDDIAYYQQYGVNWNEEDDEYHKVSEDNKALYGVLTINNISSYKARIVYLPKIDTSTSTSLYNVFNGCGVLVAIPKLDTRNVTNMNIMFYMCYSLVVIPPLDTQNVTNMAGMFNGCSSLKAIPLLDTSNVTNMNSMFNGCKALVDIPNLNTGSVTNMGLMFNECSSLISIPPLDTQKVTDMNRLCQSARSLKKVSALDASANNDTTQMFAQAVSLEFLNLKNLKKSLSLNTSSLLSKDSLLYIINNEAATEPITITLASYAYERLAEDADIIAALAAHPNISLAQ